MESIGVSFIGTSGQTIDSLLRYVRNSDPLVNNNNNKIIIIIHLIHIIYM